MEKSEWSDWASSIGTAEFIKELIKMKSIYVDKILSDVNSTDINTAKFNLGYHDCLTDLVSDIESKRKVKE